MLDKLRSFSKGKMATVLVAIIIIAIKTPANFVLEKPLNLFNIFSKLFIY